MADFIIVGGGVYGCGVAWELAQQGADVCLLEANHIASGASGGLGKRGVRANGRATLELPLMKMAHTLWPTLHEQIGADTGFERCGHLLLIENPLDWHKAAAQSWLQNEQGIPSHMLSQAQLREREPLVSKAVIGALFCPNDGVADHTATTRGYATAAQKLGATIREQTAVSALERQGDQITAVITSQEERLPVGKKLLLLSNAHILNFVQQQLNITLPLWPMLPQVMLTQPVSPVPIHHLIGHAHRRLAMKPAHGNRIMVSGGWHGTRNPQTGQGETRPDQVAGNLADAATCFPSLQGVKVEEATADRTELIAVDDLPIMGALPGATNLIMAAGWSGHGWAISPAVCRLLATWAITGQRPALLQGFEYGRFLA